MAELEPDIRDAFERRLASMPPRPGLRVRIGAAVMNHSARPRRWQALTASAAIVVLGAAVFFILQVRHSQTGPIVHPSPSPSGTSLQAPSTFFADVENGRIGAISTATGQRVRYLTPVTPGPFYAAVFSLSLSADRQTVYFGRLDGTCAAHLAAVSASGGPEMAVLGSRSRGHEGQPAIRPTGHQIAFLREDCVSHKASMVVADLDSGSEQAFPVLVQGFGTSWSSDGSRLAYVDGTAIIVMDVNKAGKVTGSHRLAAEPGCRLRFPRFIPQGLADVQSCGTVGGPNLQEAIVELDPDTGALTHTFVRIPAGAMVTSLSVDAGGKFFIYGFVKGHVQLYWLGDGRATLISANYLSGEAVW